jgi:hypothetical protein
MIVFFLKRTESRDKRFTKHHYPIVKLLQMLIAGIPIIANSIASRSYFDYNGIFIYENNQELAELILNQNFCLPKLPPPPTQHEYRFLDYITQLVKAN